MKNFFSWMREHTTDSIFYIGFTLILIAFVWVDSFLQFSDQPRWILIAWCLSTSVFITLASLAWIFQVYLKSTDQIDKC